jgi:hypothetical protein
MTVTLPRGEARSLCISCLQDALQLVLFYLDALTVDQALEILASIDGGDGVALEQAMQAAGLSLEETP